MTDGLWKSTDRRWKSNKRFLTVRQRAEVTAATEEMERLGWTIKHTRNKAGEFWDVKPPGARENDLWLRTYLYKHLLDSAELQHAWSVGNP